MKNILRALLIIALLITGNIAGVAQSADDVIQKHIAATGGADNWKKIHSMRKTCARNSRGVETPIIITTVQGKGYKSEYTMNGMTGYYIITDKNGWNYNPFRGQQKADIIPDESVKQAQDALDIQGPLIDYKAKGNKVTSLGTDDVEGTECYKLKVIFPTGKEETIYIDVGNYYPVRTVIKTKANGKEQLQTATYGDYQSLPEGIIYPMSTDAGGSSVTIKKIEVNVPVDENIFKPGE